MGQSESNGSFVDGKEDENLFFFRDLDVSTVQKLILKWNNCDNCKGGSIIWSDYFRVLQSVQGELEESADVYARSSWSPICYGYAMTPENRTTIDVDESAVNNSISQRHHPRDDHTDDDVSDSDSAKLDSPRSPNHLESAISIQPSRSHFSHPAFFGFSTETAIQLQEKMQISRKLQQDRENRAMDRAITARQLALKQMEDQFCQQKLSREKKIDSLRKEYELEEQKRKSEYERSVKGLDSGLAVSIKVRFLTIN
jgi:hypothetical protein